MADETALPPSRRMLRLTVIVKARDTFDGKPLVDVLLSLYKKAEIAGATVTHAARGYGSEGWRGRTSWGSPSTSPRLSKR